MNNMNPVAPSFLGRVLVVTNDTNASEQVSESLTRFALLPEPCPHVPSALERLKRAKFEAVVVDFRLGNQAGPVMEGTRQSPSNRHAVIFTVSDSEAGVAEAFKAGSTFVLRRPLSTASIDLSLKAAYGLIVREKRRYFRYPVETPVEIIGAGMPTARGRTVNVSEGGMSVTADAMLKPGQHAELHFTLPGDDFQFGLEAKVCWATERRLGLQFLSPNQTFRLQEWLSRRLEEAVPQSVMDKFSTSPRSSQPS